MLPVECVRSGQPSCVPSRPWPPGMAHVKVPTGSGHARRELGGFSCVPTWLHRRPRTPRQSSSPPSGCDLPTTQTGPSQAGALRAGSDARGLGQRGAVDGEERPGALRVRLLGKCGAWKRFLCFPVEPEYVPKPPPVSYSLPTPCQLLLPGLSLPSTGGTLGSLGPGAPGPRLLQGSSPGPGLCRASTHTLVSYSASSFQCCEIWIPRGSASFPGAPS